MRTRAGFLAIAAAVVLVETAGHAALMPAPPALSFSRQLGRMRIDVLREIGKHLPAPPADKAHRIVLGLLKGSSVPREFIDTAFSAPEVKFRQEIVDRFNKPGESLPYSEYRKIFINPKRIQAGGEFYLAYKPLIDRVAADYGVDPFIIVSIPGVETYFGRYTGRFTVFNALYTAIHGVSRRANWAARELAAFLKFTYADAVAPHTVFGSYAGAFGYFQFIPSSFLYYAVDYDGDGVRNPTQWPDVLGSIANYLRKNGYKHGETDYSDSGSIWKAIYAYNHSDNYVRVVLELRSEILKGFPSEAGQI